MIEPGEYTGQLYRRMATLTHGYLRERYMVLSRVIQLLVAVLRQASKVKE
jgi:hypothetical protein